MTILFLALWLQMSAPLRIAANSYHFTNYVDCDLVLADGTAKNCKIKAGHTLDDVVNESAAVDRAINESQKDTGWSNEGNGGGDLPIHFLAESAQRAAEQTDGKQVKPGATYQIDPSKPFPSDHNQFPEVKMCGGNPPHPCNEPPVEPVDVPAVQVGYYDPPECHEMKCIHVKNTCADKSRILEHDENSPPKYWCRKVQF